MRGVRLFNDTCGEQIGEKIGGEQITVLLPSTLYPAKFFISICYSPPPLFHPHCFHPHHDGIFASSTPRDQYYYYSLTLPYSSFDFSFSQISPINRTPARLIPPHSYQYLHPQVFLTPPIIGSSSSFMSILVVDFRQVFVVICSLMFRYILLI